jgi:hypothetical protein
MGIDRGAVLRVFGPLDLLLSGAKSKGPADLPEREDKYG